MVHIQFENPGNVGAAFQVRAGDVPWGPWSYTVGPRRQISDQWPIATENSTYDLAVHGPNGFLRHFKGGLARGVSANVLVSSSYAAKGRGLTTVITNDGNTNYRVTATNLYTGRSVEHTLAPGTSATTNWKLTATSGWYDIVITVDADANFAWRLRGTWKTAATAYGSGDRPGAHIAKRPGALPLDPAGAVGPRPPFIGGNGETQKIVAGTGFAGGADEKAAQRYWGSGASGPQLGPGAEPLAFFPSRPPSQHQPQHRRRAEQPHPKRPVP